VHSCDPGRGAAGEGGAPRERLPAGVRRAAADRAVPCRAARAREARRQRRGPSRGRGDAGGWY